MSAPVIVIGAGIGGLTAALRLARRGRRVIVLEARTEPGGLAGGVIHGGLAFDAGPYVLLDRDGLAWAFSELGLDFATEVPVARILQPYVVSAPGHPDVVFHADLAQTADGFERQWPGSGLRYRRFVAAMAAIHARLRPLLFRSRPGLGDLLGSGAWRDVPFLMRSLGSVLRSAGLPPAVSDALAIWTHVAGQTVARAPSPLAFVPALLHDPGAFYPRQGIGRITAVLAAAATTAGVELRCGTAVSSIRTTASAVTGVTLATGEQLDAATVLADAHGVGTYLRLLPATPPAARKRLAALPLQSPGICVYLAVKPRAAGGPYLRFMLPGGDQLCRLLVTPGAVLGHDAATGWQTARLIAPLRHGEAAVMDTAGQETFAAQLIAEPWWQDAIGEHRVLHVRVPTAWGTDYHLHRDSMNPVMTASFMRAGRLAHRSPHARGLHLAGSSTHPGQWLSFCAISGILAADGLLGNSGA